MTSEERTRICRDCIWLSCEVRRHGAGRVYGDVSYKVYLLSTQNSDSSCDFIPNTTRPKNTLNFTPIIYHLAALFPNSLLRFLSSSGADDAILEIGVKRNVFSRRRSYHTRRDASGGVDPCLSSHSEAIESTTSMNRSWRSHSRILLPVISTSRF
ncbi:hypothetical protein BDZ89DRAFT_338510 [Hymenopellis radicata]|nr:hypothetical protein BDZ89DRAFT_338510 [Hymenopellis radicata]